MLSAGVAVVAAAEVVSALGAEAAALAVAAVVLPRRLGRAVARRCRSRSFVLRFAERNARAGLLAVAEFDFSISLRVVG